MFRTTDIIRFTGLTAAIFIAASSSNGQTVGLPTPRLLTTMPMGGQAGAEFEVTVSGENIDDSRDLLFSTPWIAAKAKLDSSGKSEVNKFIVSIAADAPAGVHDARMMTRLGVSSARAFSISKLPESTRTKSNISIDTAMELAIGSICNATTSNRAVDYYRFQAKAGQRVAIECAAKGIDSKLVPVLIVADSKGRDLVANRADGFIEFAPPADGAYVIKVHGLTFLGGAEYFYRLALTDASSGSIAARQPSTQRVSACSWNAQEHPDSVAADENEPNDSHSEARRITLPCAIRGAFAKAADVDTFEFSAKKGDVWWIEVASERLGLDTDPFALVQQVVHKNDREELVDIAELNDIPSPMKVSSNGYSYDGPVYDGGSPDILGKVEIKEDGTYRLRLRDLFGGTRNDPRNVYRLVIRRPTPDFALVAWAIHMELRNGDRAALSKPIALRGGATMAFEVVAIRKDGFDGDIDVGMEELPLGITACGLRIPAGKNRGILLVSADENAASDQAVAKIVGRTRIGDEYRTRIGRLASTVWPVRDASQEIPLPRLTADVPVSIGESEKSPLSIAGQVPKLWIATEGETLKIPLKMTWRCEFSGAVRLKTFGDGFESVKIIDVPLNAPQIEAELDLAALKTKPGEYAIAFYGGAVAKYRKNPNDQPQDLVDIVVSEPIHLQVKSRAEVGGLNKFGKN